MWGVDSHVRGWFDGISPISPLDEGLVLSIPPPQDPREPAANQSPSSGDKFEVPSFYISEEEAQEVLVKSLSSRSCYGRSPAKNMDIYKLFSYSAFHYTLETFSEARSIYWSHEPFSGGGLACSSDTPGVQPPHPWNIRCHPTQMFRNEVKSLKIPNTTSVTCCHSCTSSGWYKCHCCSGEGMKRCLNCCGSGRHLRTDHGGHRHPDSCWHCHGTGRKRCSLCCGDGKVVCKTCQGFRNLRRSVMLKVEFANHVTDQVLDNYDLPEELTIRALGPPIYQDTQPQVKPIDCYTQELFRLTRDTLQDHLEQNEDTRILMQRQQLRIVPITECSYTWNDRDGRFWIFGDDLEVHAPDYPQKYCWGCSLL